MMKRKLACFGLAFALAEVFAANVPPLVLLPAAALFGFLFYLYRHNDFRFPLLGALFGFGVFLLYSYLVVEPAQKWAGQQVTCTVIVETDVDASYQEGTLRGTLQVTQVEGKPANFKVNCVSFPGEQPGECFSARFLLLNLENDSYRDSYLSSGVYLQAEYLGEYVALPDSSSLRFSLDRLRRRLAGILQRWMTAEEGELEAAMLLGQKSTLRASIEDSFRQAGVSHLLAVSGLHVALLCGIFSMGRRRRFVRPLILLRAVFVLFYMFLTGLPVSVLRAGLVFLLSLAGDFFWQPTDLLTSTGVAAVLLGMQNAYAPCDVGFQLSFCAVLGVQVAGMLTHWEIDHIPEANGPLASRLVELLLHGMENLQVAFFASLATMPILVAHHLTTSGVSLLTNLFVVWMLQPALLLGLSVLFTAVVPLLGPLSRMLSILLSVWLHWMIIIVKWCADLPMAQIAFPTRYTLFVFFVLAMLAAIFWSVKRLAWYIPAATFCIIGAVAFGSWAQKNVVSISMIGTANNPCVVCTQNGASLILFRGGQSNLNALRQYLDEQAVSRVVSLVDLRQSPSDLDFMGVPVCHVEELPAYSTQTVLDDLSLDLYHDDSGNLAVIGIQDRHIAVMTGNIHLDHPIDVDVFCAAGALSDSVHARTILTCSASQKWISKVEDEQLLYSTDIPVITIRPGYSITFEEVEPLALQ